jgi:hypothetical protein
VWTSDYPQFPSIERLISPDGDDAVLPNVKIAARGITMN